MHEDLQAILLFLWAPYVLKLASLSRPLGVTNLVCGAIRLYFALFLLIFVLPNAYPSAFGALLVLFHWCEFECSVFRNSIESIVQGFSVALLTSTVAYPLVISAVLLSEYWSNRRGIDHQSIQGVIVMGVSLGLIGISIRCLGLLSCGRSFSFQVQHAFPDGHVLVTRRFPYSVIRHPCYAGWFYFVVGTQIVLQNWLTGVLVVLAAAGFLWDRVRLEEMHLTREIPEYNEYKAQVKWTGILLPIH